MNMKLNKIIIYLSAAILTQYTFAATSASPSTQATLNALTSGTPPAATTTTNPNNTTGNMVYSNVNYQNQANTVTTGQTAAPNQSKTQSNKVVLVDENLSSSNPECSASCQNVSPPKKVKKKRVVHHRSTKKTTPPSAHSWAYERFDVNFNDDVSKLPAYLQQFDPKLVILPALGKKTENRVSFNMQQASMDQIASTVEDQTSGAAKIIYNNSNDEIRISYQAKMDFGKDDMQQSIAWQNGKGKPKPILGPDGIVLFPYGQYSPIIICQPMQVCSIAFDKGEKILDANIGDTQRWIVTGALIGDGPTQVQDIVLKPLYDNLNTNLLVTTNMGRIYNITLQSSSTGYLSMAGFYYPQQLNNELDKRLSNLKKELGGVDTYEPTNIKLNSPKTAVGPDGELPGLKIQNGYTIAVEKGNPSWKPIDVFNDGVHTYIKLDKGFVHSAEDPILLGMDENGQYEIMNYTVKGNFFVADVIFDRAVMVDNINDVGNIVYITRKGVPVTKNWLF